MNKTKLLLVPFLGLAAPVFGQGPCYVDATASGANNGSSWTNAYTDLAKALVASSAVEFWVAKGTYVPASKTSSIVMKSNAAVYGGFAGTETKRADRDPAKNLTVLSGDLSGNDLPGGVNRQDNAAHVVTGTGLGAKTLLDGVTIRGGYAVSNNSGGGVSLTDSSLTFVDCRITDNWASWGGGISTYKSGTVTLERCTLDLNHLHLYRGGALNVGTGTNAKLTDCEIKSNSITSAATHGNGAGIYGDLNSNVELRRCRFVSNIVDFRFGGSGYAPSGGAITFLGTKLVVDECLFDSNRAPDGGAIFTYRSATITESVFVNNHAARAFNLGGYGGAIVNVSTAVSTMRNCVVYGNVASEDGGGVYGNKQITLIDSIVWGNRDSNGTVGESQAKATIQRYCCIQNYLTPRPGEDPIDPKKYPGCTLKDPLFVGASSRDFRLRATSPCVDTGDPASPGGTLGFYGNPRRLDGDLDGAARVDMGAHEFSNIHLAAAVTSTSTTRTLKLDTTGLTGLGTWLAIGREGSGVPLPPFGTLFVDPTIMVLVPLASVPTQWQLSAPAKSIPPGGWQLELQALGYRGSAGNLSNPVAVHID